MKLTTYLILLCIGITLLAWTARGEFVENYLAFSGINLEKGRFWTPITALFVHANLSHLLGNMLFLFVFGSTLERFGGTGKLFTTFFLGGIVSFLMSVPIYSTRTTMIGASAAIFSLTAVIMLMKPLKFSWLFLMPQGLVALLYFLFNLLAIFYGMLGSVAYASHIIGFLTGIPLGIAWSPSWGKNLLISMAIVTLYVLVLYWIGLFI